MNTQIKNLQDNSLLYELSLAVGSSLDTYENCEHFLQTLVRVKGLGHASVWLKKEGGAHELFFTTSSGAAGFRHLPAGHFVLEKLEEQPYFTTTKMEGGLTGFIHEKKVGKGALAFFKLGSLGFLQLFSLRETGFPEGEMAQLKNVVKKFAISLEGCEAHRQLLEETEQRKLMETALKKVNRRVKESENKLRQVIDYSLDAVVTIDPGGRVAEWSKQAEKMFGILREEALGVSIVDLIVPEAHRVSFEKNMAYFRQTGEGAILNKRIEITALRKGRKPFPIELSISVLRNEKGNFLSGFIRDISERKVAEEALANAQIRLTSLITNLQAGVLLENENRDIVLANHYYCGAFRIPSEPAWLVGKKGPEIMATASQLFADPEAFLERVEELLAGAELVVGEVLHMADGRILERDFVPLFSDKKHLGQLWQYRDVTPQRMAQKEAEQARLAERQFLANMSHEIRTPMNAVIGMSHLLVETDLTPKQKDYLNSLRFSADSLMGIINDILDLSKIEAGELEFEEKAFDLDYLLRSIQRTFQFKVREKPISVTLDLEAKIERLVIGDPTRLNQVLTNLLGNASKFTKQGTIGLKTVLLGSTPEEYFVEFRVHDTGIGIAAEKLDDIFENFKQADVKVTRKYGGTGLGLTIVKQLVEKQGGKIRVESEPGKGSVFIFSLPLKNSGRPILAKPKKEREVLPDRHAFFEKLDILIVEDNRMNQKLITQILEMWGCRFRVANNGLEALLMSRTKRFDLILMDVHMPEMDGVEATQKIREDGANINQETPIVALTAAALLEEKNRALESGMDDFLTKPFSPRKLEKCILDILSPVEISPPPPPEKVECTAQKTPGDRVEIDLKYLFEFSNGDRHFVIDMVETYLRETPAVLEKLERGLAAQNWEQVRKTVHQLKPNFMMLGMEAQRAKAADTEAKIKAGNIDPIQIAPMVKCLMSAARQSFSILQKKVVSG